MIKCGEVYLDPKRISSMQWEHHNYMNGPGEPKLIITMENGTQHIVSHQPHMYGGVDAYALEKEILKGTS